ncbi:MAG: chloride channel protein [Desulfobulbaceae bacterium]|uniref:Chloride channel protein n=1 Tax=Candidatus Desulfobia pelagia TaxID=2841692 RepID=A0A8J6TGC5_9BACT|nr:chloride channel protein [Candidatus Desulfobia pelagia]
MKKRFFSKILDQLGPREGVVLMFMSVAVGAATGFAAVFFIHLISLIHQFAFGDVASSLPGLGRFWLIIIPVCGALIGGPIIVFFASEAKGHGVPEVMQALILRGGRIRPRVAIAKIISSALCIGTGGSAGREGPIVQVGSTLGSTLGQWLGFSDERTKNLVACGAAAGIAATFNAPIAGIIFAVEVLLCEIQVTVFGNVVIAAVSASIVSQFFLGTSPAFSVPSYSMHSSWEILLYVILGLLAAFVGIFFIRLLDFFETLFEKMNAPHLVKPAIGALMLGILAFFYPHVSSMMALSPGDSRLGLPLLDNVPHVYGSGFDFIAQVLQGDVSFGLLLMLVFLKPLATCFTLGSGNSGGVFAPSLFTGAMLGGAFGYAIQYLFPSLPIEIGAYALVGMASVFAAAARAPLTAMLIVFEMSNDYMLILPLMAAGMTASFVANWLYSDSIYTIKLTKRGIHFEQGRDMDIMQGVMVEEVMNHSPVSVKQDQTLAELFAIFHETRLHGFPVMDQDNKLAGFVSYQDMERTLQDIDRTSEGRDISLKDIKVSSLATPQAVTVFPDEPIWEAIRKMAPRDLARMPVVSRQDPETMVGLISRSDILKAYQIGVMRKQQGRLMSDQVALQRDRDICFVELVVDGSSRCVGKTLGELPLHQSTAIVSIKRENAFVIPGSGAIFQEGDFVTIFCRTKHEQEMRDLFGGDQAKGC